MKERGILFSAPMVRAILDGTKTQTRRVVKPQPMHTSALPMPVIEGPAPGHVAEGMVWFRSPKVRWNSPCREFELARIMVDLCPYGTPGDRLWVRETWQYDPNETPEHRSVVYRATDPGWDDSGSGLKWRPSLLMPRWASRITLEITEVRVERLHSISDADIRAEGVTAEAVEALVDRDYITKPVNEACYEAVHIADASPRDLWRVGWSAINGAASWDANPLLWCLTFQRVQP